MAEDSPNPGIAASCPRCGAPLRYLATKSGAAVHLYVCQRDGLFTLTADAPEPIPPPEDVKPGPCAKTPTVRNRTVPAVQKLVGLESPQIIFEKCAMPMRDVLPASTRGPAVPFCFVCQHRLSVRLLARQPDSGDAQDLNL